MGPERTAVDPAATRALAAGCGRLPLALCICAARLSTRPSWTVRYLADRIGVMYLGKLVEVGPGTDIYEKSAHPYTAGLLEAIPVPDPESAKDKGEKVAIRGELPSPINPPSGCRFRTRCPRAQDLCAEELPPLRPFGPDHYAACHFPLQTPLDGNGSAPEPAVARPPEPASETS